MGRFEVAPAEVRELGVRVRSFGPTIRHIAGEASSLSCTASQPPQTGRALDELAASWSRGLSRLADDVQVLAGLAQLAANGYEVVDAKTMPEVVAARPKR